MNDLEVLTAHVRRRMKSPRPFTALAPLNKIARATRAQLAFHGLPDEVPLDEIADAKVGEAFDTVNVGLLAANPNDDVILLVRELAAMDEL